MPLYEYKCEACGGRFELIRKFSDPALEVCALCEKGPITRLQSAPAIQFKGSGFYITDYARQGGEKGKPDKASTEQSKDAKSDAAAAAKSGASEAKTDTAPKTDAPAKSDAPAKPASPPPAASPSSAKT
jgi:putative FmdB family regulatory protein